MGELTLTGLDEVVLQRLSQLAAEHGRSVADEAAAILKLELARQGQVPRMTKEKWLDLAAETRRQTDRLDISMVDLIREGRDER